MYKRPTKKTQIPDDTDKQALTPTKRDLSKHEKRPKKIKAGKRVPHEKTQNRPTRETHLTSSITEVCQIHQKRPIRTKRDQQKSPKKKCTPDDADKLALPTVSESDIAISPK